MPTRLLICTNETLGLGHIRRALRLSAFLQSELDDLSILILTGSVMIHGFRLPSRVDAIKLPSLLRQRGEPRYTSRYLPLPFEEVKQLRERLILESALAYRPDMVLVDLRPTGVAGELLPTLRAVRENRRTVVVLGCRDVISESDAVRVEWRADHAMSALEELYDEIWVYGAQALYDPIAEYQLSQAIAEKVRFCGYLGIELPGSSVEETRRDLGIGEETFVLVTVGNGRDGFPLLDAYLGALESFPRHQRLFTLLVGGPDLPGRDRERVRQQATELAISHPQRRLKLIDFSADILTYMAAADVIVSMGGYNTLVEILALGKRALVIPRVVMNREQLVRASLFERLGLLTMLHPDRLSPGRMAESLLKALDAPSPSGQDLRVRGVPLSGLGQVKRHVVRLLGERARLPLAASR